MPHDARRWEGFGPKLTASREVDEATDRKKINLHDIGLYSAGHLSRVENNLATPSRQLVARYEELTGRRDLLTEFDERLGQDRPAFARTSVDADAPIPARLIDRETIVDLDIMDGVRIIHRDVIVPTMVPMTRMRLDHVAYPNGRGEYKLPKTRAYRARTYDKKWVSQNYWQMSVSFPRPLTSLVRPYDYTVFYTHEGSLYPRESLRIAYRIPRYRLTVMFPRKDIDVFRLDGLNSTVADDWTDAVHNGRPHPLPREKIDRIFQVSVSFHDLTPGLVYGLVWSPRVIPPASPVD